MGLYLEMGPLRGDDGEMMSPNPMCLVFLGDQDTEGQPCEDTGRRSFTHQGERPEENQPCWDWETMSSEPPGCGIC